MQPTVGGSETADDAAAGERREGLARGSAVGRYIVLSRIGAGGMGVVYAAYDPELDRRVALKLLRPERAGSPNALARVLREAQAMARLNHPNVVTLHDVGEHDGTVFLAMEFVEGLTLAQWREVATPGRRELLAVLLAAGEGLAAAHDKGIVHRDFKPDNVMIGDDGRVRVMDFGLARGGAGLEPGRAREDEHERPAAEVLAAELTRHGAIMGTPGYMAPEQHAGRPVGEAADQFSFCVTLYESLWGERPFQEPPRATAGPRWLQRVVLRGLAADPGERWPSMRALLDALRRDPTPRRKRAAAFATVLALVAGGAAYRLWLVASRERACDAAVAEIDARWNPSAAAGVRAAMRATGLPHAEATAERAADRLDEFAAEWREARAGLCGTDEPAVEHEGPALACLDDRAAELDELVAALSTPTRAMVDDAIAASASLTPPRRCLTPNGVSPDVDGSIAAGAAGRAIRERLARAGARRWVSDHGTAITLAEAAMAEADALGIEGLGARARYELGAALIHRSEYARAETLLREAFVTASALGDDGVAADAAQALVYTVGFNQARHAEAELWVELCAIQHDRLRLPADDPRRAALRSETATLRYAQGRLAEAREDYRAALAIYERTSTPDDPGVIGSRADLALVESMLGNSAAADVISARVVADSTLVYGPDHPRTGQALVSRTEVLRTLGRPDEALGLARRVLEIRERALGPESEEVASALLTVALLLPANEERRECLQRARTTFLRVHGPDHPTVARSDEMLARWYLERDDPRAAVEHYERALAGFERAGAAEQVDTAATLLGLGRALEQVGRHEEARDRIRSAIATGERALGDRHWLLAPMRFTAGRLALALGDAEVGLAELERAQALGEPPVPTLPSFDVLPLYLARARWELDRDRPGAAAELRASLPVLRDGMPPALLAELEAWMTARGLADPTVREPQAASPSTARSPRGSRSIRRAP